MEKQQSKTSIYEALFNFQNECPIIPKGKQGYGYNYADIAATMSLVRPILEKNGLGYTQLITLTDIDNPDGQSNALRTILFHVGGETLETLTFMPKSLELRGMNIFQTDGAKFTYYKRYALLSLLGVWTEDEDKDAAGKENKKPNSKGKPKLDDGKLIKAITSIKLGKHTPTSISDVYDLTESQMESLNTAFEQFNNPEQ
jgi:hypothetical protein